MTIFDEIGDGSLQKYLNACSDVSNLDAVEAFNITKRHIAAFRNSNLKTHKSITQLQQRWYRSLKDDEPDYSVYEDPIYFCDLWLCWISYSRRYLKDIQKPNSFINQSIVDFIKPKTVVDLGCGFGYTTAALKEIFPSAIVYGTNIKNTAQYKAAAKISKKCDFKLRDSFKSIKADLIFASEYFEHFEEPIAHLLEVLSQTKPKYLLLANAFGTKSIGHFDWYKDAGNIYSGKEISKFFSKTLIESGYEKMKTKLWNNRPSFWIMK